MKFKKKKQKKRVNCLHCWREVKKYRYDPSGFVICKKCIIEKGLDYNDPK